MDSDISTIRIGDLATQVGVTPKTIRYYESIGLLSEPQRAPNGYRSYGTGDRNRLLFIQRAKALGLSLDEIRDLITVAEDGECTLTKAELRQILDRKIADCMQRIDALLAFRATLEAAAERLDTSIASSTNECCPSCAAFAPTCTCVPVPDPADA